MYDNHKMMELLFGELADDVELDHFDRHIHTDNMALVEDPNSGEPLIAFTLGDKEYVLSIKVNDLDDWQVYDPHSGVWGILGEHHD